MTDVLTLDCQGCGLALPPSPRGPNVYAEDDELTCVECRAVNVVFTDDTVDEVYVGAWKCAHGVDGDDLCAACEPSEGGLTDE